MNEGDAIEERQLRRLRVARGVAAVGGIAHIVAPELFVLPQDPAGPTIGIDPSTWALRIIGIIAIAGALVVKRLATVGRILLGAAAVLSTFIVVWEFRPPAYVLILPMVAAAALLFTPSATSATTVESRRAAIGTIAIGGYLCTFKVASRVAMARGSNPHEREWFCRRTSRWRIFAGVLE